MVSGIFIGLVITLLLTPGPTNTLLASSGLQAGLKNSLKLIPAEVVGYFIAVSLWGGVIGEVVKTMTGVIGCLKLLSAGYIIYLAIKLWKSADFEIVLNGPVISTKALLITTLLNPKALLFASGIFPAEAFLKIELYALHMIVFLLLIIPISLFWMTLGSLLSKNKIKFLNHSKLQKMASIVLTIFSIPLSYSAIHNF